MFVYLDDESFQLAFQLNFFMVYYKKKRMSVFSLLLMF